MRTYNFADILKFETSSTMGKLESEILSQVRSLSENEAKLVNKAAWKLMKDAIEGTHQYNNFSRGNSSFYWEFVYQHNICEQIKKESYKRMMGYI